MGNILLLSTVLLLASAIDLSVWPAINLPLPQLVFAVTLAVALQPRPEQAALRLAIGWPVLGLALGWVHLWTAAISVALTGLAALLNRRWLDLTNPFAATATTFAFLITHGGLTLALPSLWGQEGISLPGWLGLSWYAVGAMGISIVSLWQQRRLTSV